MCYLSPTRHHHIWIIKISQGQLQSFKFRCILSRIQYRGLEGRGLALWHTGTESSRRTLTCHSFFTGLRAWICSARLTTAGWFTCILEIQLRSEGDRTTLFWKSLNTVASSYRVLERPHSSFDINVLLKRMLLFSPNKYIALWEGGRSP